MTSHVFFWIIIVSIKGGGQIAPQLNLSKILLNMLNLSSLLTFFKAQNKCPCHSFIPIYATQKANLY